MAFFLSSFMPNNHLKILLSLFMTFMLISGTNAVHGVQAQKNGVGDNGGDDGDNGTGDEPGIDPTNRTEQKEPVALPTKSGCNGGQSVSAEYRSGMNGVTDTKWTTLGLASYDGSGEPDWSPTTWVPAPLPPATASSWNDSRVQMNTPYFINNAMDYTYGVTGSTTSPGQSQYIWIDSNSSNIQWSTGHGTTAGHDFNGYVGAFAFRHDFQVPANAYDFEFAMLPNADDRFIKDPYIGSNDFSIRLTSNLDIPVTNLGPNPSDTHPAPGAHIGGNVQLTPIQFATGVETSFYGQTDLSMVFFVENTRQMGAVGYHFTVKYCTPPTPPQPPFTLPSNGTPSVACPSNYQSGVLSLSSSANTGYRMHTGSSSTSWYQSATVSGNIWDSLATGQGTIANPLGYMWGDGDQRWNSGGPIQHQISPWTGPWGNLGPLAFYGTNAGEVLPPNAEDAEWIWNSNYTKEQGIHDFGQLVSLSGLNIPPTATLTALDAVVYFSADHALLMVSTSDQSQTTNYGTLHVDVGIATTAPPSLQTLYYDHVFRTGDQNNIMVPIIDPTTNQPPAGNDVLFKITALEHTHPQYAGSGITDGLHPAGLRFAILVCADWEFPVSPIQDEKCTAEETVMHSGQNETEIRALQRDNSGMSTFIQGSSTPSGPIAPHYNPVPWQDMEILSYQNLGQPTGAGGQTFSVLNEEYHQYAHGYYIAPNGWGGLAQYPSGGLGPWTSLCEMYQTANYQADWFPNMFWQSGSNCYAAITNNNAYQPHNANADWLMYGNPIVDGTLRTPGTDSAHFAPQGLKEIRIPFTIPADAEPGSVSIFGDIGIAADMVQSVGFGYIYPACIGPGGSLNAGTPLLPCWQEEGLFPEFTHGVSIVSATNPSVALQSVTADPFTSFRQTDGHHKTGAIWGGHGDGLPLNMQGVQAPGDYFLKFYVAADPLLLTDYENPPTAVNPVTGDVIDSTPREQFIPFAIKWAFDVQFEVCDPPVSSSGTGTSGGNSMPFLPPTSLVLIMAVATYVASRRFEKPPEDELKS